MRVSDRGVDLIKSYEGVRLEAYRDSVGVWTIGYGHTAAAGRPYPVAGLRISSADADEILRRDLVTFSDGVAKLINVDLEQRQFDSVVSFAFNVGLGNLAKSTLLKRINARQFDLVPAEFLKWNKAGGKVLPGLTRRRHAEAAMFSESPNGLDNSDDARATPDAPVPAKSIVASREGNAAAVSGALASAGAASQAVDQLQQASDTISGFMALAQKPSFWVFIVILGAAAAIWYWRRQRLLEEGS